MIVEFCGLSGAGKTTLARALAARLEERGIPVALVDPKLLYAGREPSREQWLLCMRFLLCRPAVGVGLIIALAALLFGNGMRRENARQRLRLMSVWMRRFLVYVSRTVALREIRKVHVLDRGLITNLLSVLVRVGGGDVTDLYRRLVCAGGASDLVVHVNVPAEVARARRVDRGTASDARDPARGESEVRRLVALVQSEGEAGRCRLLEVDAQGSNSIAGNVDAIVHTILPPGREAS